MTLQEAIGILNRLSPNELRGLWMTNYQQMMVQTAVFGVSVSIDIREFDKLPDDQIKELIYRRMICSLEDKLSILQGEPK